MIDKIINFLFTNHFEKHRKNTNFTVNDIQKYFIYKDGSHTLKIILPGWGNGVSWTTKVLARRLSQRGFSCLVYSLPRTILPYDPHIAPAIFNIVKESIKENIVNIKSQYNFKKIDIISTSLGVVTACLIANDNKDIINTFFIVPGSCLASSLWDGVRTQRLKQIYEAQGMDKEKLKKIWHSLAPKNNISILSSKGIFIAISKSDKVIPYSYGREFAELSKKLYPDTLIKENLHLGHYLTTVKYYLFGKELLK